MTDTSPLLFRPLRLRELTLANRIAIAPMCQYSAVEGCAQPWHLQHLGSLAVGDPGLVVIEATAVEPIGRITPQDLGLYDDRTEAALAELVRSIRTFSKTPLGIQLAHAGRKAATQRPWEGGGPLRDDQHPWRVVGASPVANLDGWQVPEELDEAGLGRIRDAFATAARRAERIGLDLIEIHAAHGYLLHTFLSPLSNRREDGYGGSLENRMRFPLEVIDAVRAVWPGHKPLTVRVSATDWLEGGLTPEDIVVFARELKHREIDYVCVSSGGIALPKIALRPGYQVPFAAKVREEAGIATRAVGLITDPRQAEAVLQEGQADLVAIARAALYDPRWPWHAARELGFDIPYQPQYLRCAPRREP